MVDDTKLEQALVTVMEKYTKGGISYIEALTQLAERFGIEVEVLGDIVKRSNILTAKVRLDAEELNLIEKTSRLPI
jgi:hypothetical protein